MANITQILGTDSLSSSRIILNDNFSELNTGLSEIEALLDTANQDLTLTGKISGAELQINNGTIDTLLVTSNQVVHNVESKVSANLLIEKGIVKKTAASSATSGIISMPVINEYEESTYFIDATAPLAASPILLNAGVEGREVTFIPVGGSVLFDVTNISGYTTDINVNDGRSITLRCYNSIWYVISNNS